jgi:hypothetical protein
VEVPELSDGILMELRSTYLTEIDLNTCSPASISIRGYPTEQALRANAAKPEFDRSVHR